MDIIELIQALPPEICKIIYKEFIKIKLRERADLGWDEVNAAIKEALFCGYNQQIVKVLKCFSCEQHCFKNDHCILCKRDGFYHYLGYPIYDEDDYDQCFNVHWDDKWRGGDIIRQIGIEEVLHAEIKPPPLWKDSYGFKRVKFILNPQPRYFLR